MNQSISQLVTQSNNNTNNSNNNDYRSSGGARAEYLSCSTAHIAAKWLNLTTTALMIPSLCHLYRWILLVIATSGLSSSWQRCNY